MIQFVGGNEFFFMVILSVQYFCRWGIVKNIRMDQFSKFDVGYMMRGCVNFFKVLDCFCVFMNNDVNLDGIWIGWKYLC